LRRRARGCEPGGGLQGLGVTDSEVARTVVLLLITFGPRSDDARSRRSTKTAPCRQERHDADECERNHRANQVIRGGPSETAT
jgi:hypothetical protein